AAAAARAAAHLPRPPARWFAMGGGRRNPALIAALAARIGAPVAPIDAVGFDGDMIEAQAFAHLALRAARGLALSFPATTGAPRPLPGGARHAPPRG
ncbi:MAG: anhydro-N-acetylmuramic acid kinase, partial [Pseudomonadota bacterium]